jgi:DNA-binding transcriptional LysR family regulator
MKLPSMKHLRAFEAVGRLGSVRQAALELGLDHSVVSRHVRAAQADIGVKLVDISPRGVELTDVGKRYHESVFATLRSLAAATDEAARSARPHMLMVWANHGFALRWLTPRLDQFQRAHPRIEITLRSADTPADLMRSEVDVAITYGAFPGPGLRSIVLARPRAFPVASPAWIARHKTITAPPDLLRAPLIHEESERQWRSWLVAAGVDPPAAFSGLRLSHAHLAIEAAKRGQGVAIANELLAGDDIASGDLVEIGRTDIHLAPYTLAARADRWSQNAVERFRTWIVRNLPAI